MESIRLKRVARYLASQGLYKEAAQIKKLAQPVDDVDKKYKDVLSFFKEKKEKASEGGMIQKMNWEQISDALVSFAYGEGEVDMQKKYAPLKPPHFQAMCKELGLYEPEMDGITEFTPEERHLDEDDEWGDPDTGVGRSGYEDEDEDEY